MIASKEGPLGHAVWTAFTHLLIAGAITFVCGTGAHFGTELGWIHPLHEFGATTLGAGFADGLYVGRELGESDSWYSVGSVLDMAGAIVGVFVALFVLRSIGWIAF